jgi:hypothetical protein
MLRHDAKLYPHHVDRSHPYDFSKPIAEVMIHPQQPHIWGLKNVGQTPWVATTRQGEVLDVAPGRNVTIATGTRVHFGESEGELRL